jgi:glycosyltransferase involved in cell wall biosynthesis
MSLLSVVTPVYSPDPDHLRAAYETLCRQTLPAGWEWEWVVQEDGVTGIVSQILPADERVRIGTGRRGGVALTRNMALARTRGTLIKNLDGDDVLADGALHRDVSTLDAERSAQWVTSRVLDLLPDGSTVGFDNDPQAGLLAPGYVLDHWRRHNYRLPVHPTTVCIRRPLVVALGGWMGVPGSDDTGMLVAASVISSGYFISDVGLYYRKWPGQETASAAHIESGEWESRMALINDRAEALAALWQSRTLVG